MNQTAKRSLLGFLFFDVLGDGLWGEMIFRSEVSNFRTKQAPLTHGEKKRQRVLPFNPVSLGSEREKIIGFRTWKYLLSYISASVLELVSQNMS